jgi:hypothetical protein
VVQGDNLAHSCVMMSLLIFNFGFSAFSREAIKNRWGYQIVCAREDKKV